MSLDRRTRTVLTEETFKRDLADLLSGNNNERKLYRIIGATKSYLALNAHDCKPVSGSETVFKYDSRPQADGSFLVFHFIVTEEVYVRLCRISEENSGES